MRTTRINQIAHNWVREVLQRSSYTDEQVVDKAYEMGLDFTSQQGFDDAAYELAKALTPSY